MATKPRKKTKRAKPVRLEDVELHEDAWERFEKGVKAIAKATPKNTTMPVKKLSKAR